MLPPAIYRLVLKKVYKKVNTIQDSESYSLARTYCPGYPYTADDFWWNDYSGESSSTLRANFNSALKSARVSAMFSGHAHQSATRFTGVVTYYTTGYVGNGWSSLLS